MRHLISHVNHFIQNETAIEANPQLTDSGARDYDQWSFRPIPYTSLGFCDKSGQFEWNCYCNEFDVSGDTQAHQMAHQEYDFAQPINISSPSATCHCKCTALIPEEPFDVLPRSMNSVGTLHHRDCRENLKGPLVNLQNLFLEGFEVFGELGNWLRWDHDEPLLLALVAIFLDILEMPHFFSQHLHPPTFKFDTLQHISKEQIREMLHEASFLLTIGFWKKDFDLDAETIHRVATTLGAWIFAVCVYCTSCLVSCTARTINSWWNRRLGKRRFCQSRRLVSCRKRKHPTRMNALLFFGWLLLSAEAIEITRNQNFSVNHEESRIESTLDNHLWNSHECASRAGVCLHSLFPHKEAVTHETFPGIFECLQEPFDTCRCIEASRTWTFADDFCLEPWSRFHFTSIFNESNLQASHAPFSERDTVEFTKADEKRTKIESDIHSLMQTQPGTRSGSAQGSELCGRHLDPQVYWDRLSIRPAIVQNRILVWLHDPHINGLQTNLFQVPWDGIRCICCSFISSVPIARTAMMQGPFLIRPQPLNRDRTATLNFLAITEPKQAHQRIIHAQTSIGGTLRSGTVTLDTIFGFATVSALFNLVRPEHRCLTTSWCRVTWRAPTQTFVIWWPTAFAASDYSHVTLEEIENQRAAPVNAVSGPPASIFHPAPTCPDPGSTDYGDSSSLMTLSTITVSGILEHSSYETDDSVLMHRPLRMDRSRSRDRDQDEVPRNDESEDTPTTTQSSETSTEDDHSALVIYGKSIEPVLIPIDADLSPDLFRLIVLRHFAVPHGTDEENALSLHPVIPRPIDLAPCVIPMMVKFHGEHDLSTSIALIDIVLYANVPAVCNEQDDPQTFRETWRVPTSATRSVLLHWLGLTELCKQIAYPCIATYGMHPWHMQDNRPYPLLDGIYLTFRIPVPNPQMPLVF